MACSRIVTGQLKSLLITLSAPRTSWSFGYANLIAMLRAIECSKTLRSLTIRYETSRSFMPGPLEQSCRHFMVQIRASRADNPRATFIVTMGDSWSATVTKEIQVGRVTVKTAKKVAEWIGWLSSHQKEQEDDRLIRATFGSRMLL